MDIIDTLNSKIENVLEEYHRVKLENLALKQELEEHKTSNDELVRNNQDMLLQLNRTIALIEANKK
jgi:cell division protein ZapB